MNPPEFLVPRPAPNISHDDLSPSFAMFKEFSEPYMYKSWNL
jgi:hypothetical protein